MSSVIPQICPFSSSGGDSTTTETLHKKTPNTSAISSGSGSIMATIAPPYYDPYSAPAYPEGYRIDEVGPAKYLGVMGLLHRDTENSVEGK
jgi:hypothetical protein